MRNNFIEINERLADWYDIVIAQEIMDCFKTYDEPIGLK